MGERQHSVPSWLGLLEIPALPSPAQTSLGSGDFEMRGWRGGMRNTVRPLHSNRGKGGREGDSKLEWVVKINRVSSSSSKVTWGDRQKEWRKRK